MRVRFPPGSLQMPSSNGRTFDNAVAGCSPRCCLQWSAGLAGGVGGSYFFEKEVVGGSSPSRRAISGSSVGRAPGACLGD